MDRHTIFSVALLAIVFFTGFLAAYLNAKPEWACSACSFNVQEDSIIPMLNKQYPETAFAELSRAESEIDILMYEMKFYETNNSVRRLEDLLIQKSEEGVDVKVIIDQSEWHGKITALSKENQKTFDYLKENGVNVKMDDLKKTSHAKLIIIDSSAVILGSTNWGFSAFERNNEASVLIRNEEAAGYYKNYFDSIWESI